MDLPTGTPAAPAAPPTPWHAGVGMPGPMTRRPLDQLRAIRGQRTDRTHLEQLVAQVEEHLNEQASYAALGGGKDSTAPTSSTAPRSAYGVPAACVTSSWSARASSLIRPGHRRTPHSRDPTLRARQATSWAHGLA